MLSMRHLGHEHSDSRKRWGTRTRAKIVVVIHFRGDVPTAYLWFVHVALAVSHPTSPQYLPVRELIARFFRGRKQPDPVVEL